MKTSLHKFVVALFVAVTVLFTTQAYAQVCTAPPDGLVGWWPGDFHENDISGNDNHGSLELGAGYVPGVVDDAFFVPGSAEMVVPNSLDIEPASAITVDMWFKGGVGYALAKGADTCASASYAIYSLRCEGGGMCFYVWDNDNPQAGLYAPAGVLASPGTGNGTGINVFDGNWHFIAGTFDGNEACMYVDGLSAGCRTAIVNNPPYQITYELQTNNDLRIGRYLGTCQITCNNCAVDEVEIANGALSQDEIQAIYNAGSAGKCKEVTAEFIEIAVEIDVKPGSNPSCFNNNGHGVIPVAVLGSEGFDAASIDPESLSFEGLSVAQKGKSNKRLASLEDVNDDGYLDLVAKFEDEDGVFAPGDATAEVIGETFNGTPIRGEDDICVRPNANG